MARVSSALNSLLILWLGVFLRVASAELRGPPKISEQVNGFRKAVQGRSIKLPCPVTGNPPPLIMWTKDGVTIHSGWERFRVRSEGLKVNDVVIEDSGSYICRATNGFGSVSVNFTLTITDGSSSPEEDPSRVDTPTVEERPDRPTSGTMPQFSELSKMMKAQKIMKPLNSSVRLKCKASGHPRPEIVWEKDGTRMVITEGRQSRQFTLKLSHLKPGDSGTYMCIVFNKHGRINATYEVDVVDQVKKKPELLGEHPVNTTVEFGGTTSFQCRVRSDIKPHIQWLKRVETHSTPTNATIEMDGQYFVVLPAGDVLPRPDGSYLNKLIISYATSDDAGMYICLGANTMGYSFKSAFLEVFPDPNMNWIDPALQQTPRVNPVVPEAWGHIEQGLLIGIPVSLALLFIVIVIICTISRKKARSQRRRHRTAPPAPQLPNSSIKKEYNHRDYLNRTNLTNPHMMDIEQCAPLTAAQCAPMTSQQTLHIYPVPSRENVLNRYDVHSPSSFTDTLNSNGSLTSSRPNMHHHLHQHTILHC
ncbi:Fibroblast growth factor receptor-like 1 precursor [Strongylocentrotus purpuratus]|uniref:Fibroblast growth factor receptor-like 1 n=1 Tax=Strongylocentrotus purpuratus TaxID=7668 RepID=D2T1S8_STRPU|nr:Fibroblast growth factor receptor-like 1 precursor [Strongylocentrotus purpuratus]CAX53265.1 fibroblast growth factor receptor-like protein precursor [Strongylocentrotus purpuratus]|eukprot:NP_001165523.1 Fibroblast growth factor receptor-like 1 precursor [Strongylocentrotus purpuratus]